MIYTEETNGFVVEAEPSYIPEKSNPEEGQYFFAYRIRIRNTSDKKAQLKARHWVIMDGKQHREDVEGPGVVGEEPHFEPGTTYEYTSFCPLPTPTGSMRGAYIMKDESGKNFQIKIPLFFLRDHQHNQ
jgi:ApaG protein